MAIQCHRGFLYAYLCQLVTEKKNVDAKEENQKKGGHFVQRHEQTRFRKDHSGDSAYKAQEDKPEKKMPIPSHLFSVDHSVDSG